MTRPRADKSGPTELYRHFDKKGQLLYIGISLSTAARLMEHRSGSGWAGKIATITIERFRSRKVALEAERLAIQAEHPIHNVTGKLRGFRVTATSAFNAVGLEQSVNIGPMGSL